MATYYNITATIAFDQIEADTPQAAAAKAHALITAQLADPERVLVWTKGDTPSGGVEYKSSVWTFDADPQEILPPKPEAKPVAPPTEAPPVEVPLPVESNQDTADAPLSLA